jgi:hypothetical protein
MFGAMGVLLLWFGFDSSGFFIGSPNLFSASQFSSVLLSRQLIWSEHSSTEESPSTKRPVHCAGGGPFACPSEAYRRG